MHVIKKHLDFKFGELQGGKASKGQTSTLQKLPYEISNLFFKR